MSDSSYPGAVSEFGRQAPFIAARQISPLTEGCCANVTLTDIQLAAAYFPILADLALYRHCLTCRGLIERAKRLYPDRPAVQKAIAVSARRRLDVIRIFTSGRDLPDLTSLVINKGADITPHSDSKASHEHVFALDWHKVSAEFDEFLNNTVSVIKSRKQGKD